MESLADKATLTSEAHTCRKMLLSRLKAAQPVEPVVVEVITDAGNETGADTETVKVADSGAPRKTHVMLSYYNKEECGVENVKLLGECCVVLCNISLEWENWF